MAIRSLYGNLRSHPHHEQRYRTTAFGRTYRNETDLGKLLGVFDCVCSCYGADGVKSEIPGTTEYEAYCVLMSDVIDDYDCNSGVVSAVEDNLQHYLDLLQQRNRLLACFDWYFSIALHLGWIEIC